MGTFLLVKKQPSPQRHRPPLNLETVCLSAPSFPSLREVALTFSCLLRGNKCRRGHVILRETLSNYLGFRWFVLAEQPAEKIAFCRKLQVRAEQTNKDNKCHKTFVLKGLRLRLMFFFFLQQAARKK